MKAQLPTSDAAAINRAKLPTPMVAGDEFAADEPRFTTLTAARIARVDPSRVRRWGRHHGLLGWRGQYKRTAGRLWSVLDLMRLRLAAVMISEGIHAADAAWRVGSDATPPGMASATIAAFIALIDNPRAPSLAIFHPGGTKQFKADRVSFHMLDPIEPIGEVYDRVRAVSHRQEFVLFDLRDIVEHVERELAIERVVQ